MLVEKIGELWSSKYKVMGLYEGLSKSSRPDLDVFRIKLKYYLLLIVARLRTQHAQYDFWATNILCILAVVGYLQSKWKKRSYAV